MTLSDAANWANIGEFALTAVLAFGGGVLAFGYITKMRPVWRRFTKNVSRQLSIVSTEKQSMRHEAVLLSRVGFFKNIQEYEDDARTTDILASSAVIVIGYTEKSPTYKAVFNYAKANKVPLIVFAGSNRLSPEDLMDLKKYSYSSLCETELRLVSDIFATMTTFPEQ